MDAPSDPVISPADVEDLGRRAASGDTRALERLLQIHHRRFAGHAARKIGVELRGKIDAEDVLQEAYIHVFDTISEFKHEHTDSFHRWVTFLIDRALIDRVRHLRRRKRDAGREVSPPSGSGSRHDSLLDRCARDSTTPSRVARKDEAVSALMSAIAQLPEKDREVVRRVYLNEESLSTVAEEMQCTEHWVRRISTRAVERLGRRLKVAKFLSRG